MRVGEVIRTGYRHPDFPSNRQRRLSEISRSRPNAQIQYFAAAIVADVFGMGVGFYTWENEKPAVGHVSLTCSSQCGAD